MPNKILIVITIVLTLVILGLGTFIIYRFGDAKFDAGKATNQAETNEQVVRKIKNYEEGKIKIREVSDDKLISRYCKFVYDKTYEQCLSSVRTFEQINSN